MTSKEALNVIATNCAMNCKQPLEQKCSENCEVLKAFQIIQKDLKVLEILKKYLKIGYVDRVLLLSMEDTDNEKVKEWLENE